MGCSTGWRRRFGVGRPPRRQTPEPGDDVLSIVAAAEAFSDPVERRAARLRLREDALVYRLEAKRLRRNERLADSVAKFLGGSLLTTSAAVLFGGHGGAPIIGLAALALFLLVFGTMLAAAAEYRAAAWDNEADRVAAALDELVGDSDAG